MKILFYELILIITITNVIVLSENNDLKADNLYFKALNTTESLSKSEILSKAIKISNPKKWVYYAEAMFARASCNYKNNIELALEDYTYLIKNFSIFYEPYVETSFIYFNRGQYKKALNIIESALKKANSSIILKNKPNFKIAIFFKILLNEMKLIIEIILKDNKKAHKTFNEYFAVLSKNEINEINSFTTVINKHINIKFLQSFYFYSQAEFNKASQIIQDSLNTNWENESSVIILSLFQKNVDFEDFYLNIKSDFSRKKWNQELSDKRKQWQKNKWQKQFRILNKKALLF